MKKLRWCDNTCRARPRLPEFARVPTSNFSRSAARRWACQAPSNLRHRPPRHWFKEAPMTCRRAAVLSLPTPPSQAHLPAAPQEAQPVRARLPRPRAPPPRRAHHGGFLVGAALPALYILDGLRSGDTTGIAAESEREGGGRATPGSGEQMGGGRRREPGRRSGAGGTERRRRDLAVVVRGRRAAAANEGAHRSHRSMLRRGKFLF